MNPTRRDVVQAAAAVMGFGPDGRAKLLVTAAKKRTIASALHDDTGLADTGRWLEANTGFRLQR